MARASRIARLAAAAATAPVTAAVVLFAVSNREAAALRLWPLPGAADVPLYLLGLGALFLGFLAGGAVAWFAAGEARGRARAAEREARALRLRLAEAERRTALPAAAAAPPPAPAPGREAA